MKKIIIGLLGAGLLIGTAIAEPSSNVAFDKPTRALLKAADPAKGKAAAEDEDCASCHNDPDNGDAPLLEGMHIGFLFKQLKDYKDEKREQNDMADFVDEKDDQHFANLAAWYASQPAPAWSAPADAPQEIVDLVLKGDPNRGIRACASCHGRWGQGNMYDHAKIAGQKKDYLVTSLNAFKDGSRKNDIYSRMRVIAEKLSDEEVEGLASYYAGKTAE